MSSQENNDMVKEAYMVNVDKVVDDIHDESVVQTGVPYVYTETYRVDEEKLIDDVLENKHREYLLFRYLDFFRSLPIGDLKKDLENEHVFFCFEQFPHIESLLRNNIWKLGDSWSHTIVCCRGNNEFIQTLVYEIHPSIKVVVLDDPLVFVDDYNQYCLSPSFYDNFNGNYLFFTDVGGLICDNIDLSMFNDDNHFRGITLDGNTICSNFSLRNKRMLLEALENLGTLEKKPFFKDAQNIKEKYNLQTLPENIFFNHLLGVQQGNKEISDRTIVWKSFLTNTDSWNSTDIVNAFDHYLEMNLKLYY